MALNPRYKFLGIHVYRGTQAEIEAAENLPRIAFAYASDIEQIGFYNGTAWFWHGNLKSFLTVDGTTKLGDGGTTDYTEFDDTGHAVLHGDARPFDDLRIEPVARNTGANAPTFEKWFDDLAGTSRGVYLYSFDDAALATEKELFFTMQMPHSWAGNDIYLHVHWVPAATVNSSDVVWGLEYVWKDIGETFGDSTTITSSLTLVPDDANITAGKHYISSFGAITPGASANGISSILIGRLFRNSSNGNDTYTNKVGLLYVDAHYQIDTLGSTEEYTK